MLWHISLCWALFLGLQMVLPEVDFILVSSPALESKSVYIYAPQRGGGGGAA